MLVLCSEALGSESVAARVLPSGSLLAMFGGLLMRRPCSSTLEARNLQRLLIEAGLHGVSLARFPRDSRPDVVVDCHEVSHGRIISAVIDPEESHATR